MNIDKVPKLAESEDEWHSQDILDMVPRHVEMLELQNWCLFGLADAIFLSSCLTVMVNLLVGFGVDSSHVAKIFETWRRKKRKDNGVQARAVSICVLGTSVAKKDRAQIVVDRVNHLNRPEGAKCDNERQ
ncbi:hypothetical protein CRV24_004282 [Beauveria bassiana]|nr:hypothetical protein CRV24_004282 [Beauveria bassiana]KAH8710900.1 hypothetical protein HC256_007731 [Beauveria bassiana]